MQTGKSLSVRDNELRFLFAYGTLKRGFQNYDAYIAPYRPRIEPALVRGAHLWEESTGAYPFLVATREPSDVVYGELLDFSALPDGTWLQVLARLDALEEVDAGVYRREVWPTVRVRTVADSMMCGVDVAVSAWVYVYAHPIRPSDRSYPFPAWSNRSLEHSRADGNRWAARVGTCPGKG